MVALSYDRASSRVRIVAALAASTIVAVLVFSVSEPETLFSDFYKAYYPAAQAVLGERGTLEASFERGAGGFVNLPILAWLFAPFALLPPTAAGYGFFALGIAAAITAWQGLVQLATLNASGAMLLGFAFAANGPLHNSLREGNTTHFALLLLVLGLRSLRRRREIAAGACFAVAALLKLPLLAIGVYFLFRRWRVALAGAAVCAAVGAASVALFGWDLHVFWYENSLLPFMRGGLSAFNVQSIRGFVARLLDGPTHLFDWQPRSATPSVVLLSNGIVGLLLVTAVAAMAWPPRWRRASQRDLSGSTVIEIEFLIVLMLALIASTVSWSHYYAWVLVPAAFFIGSTPHLPASPLARGAGWCALLLAFPPVIFVQISDPTWLQLYGRFAVSHYLAGGCLLFTLLVLSRWSATPSGAGRPTIPRRSRSNTP